MATKQLSVIIKAIDHLSGPTRASIASLRLMGSTAGTVFGSATSAASGLISKLTSVKTLLAGAVVGLAAKATVGSFADVAKSIDDIGDASRRFGLTTEQLSQWRYAARFARVDADSLAASMSTLSKHVGQLATTGRGSSAFSLLGISPEMLRGELADINKLVPEIADRIRGLNIHQQQFVAGRLFGNEGILNLLEEGSDGINARLAEAARMGVVYTRAQTGAAAEYTDAINRVRFAWEGVRAKVVTELAPALTGFFNGVARQIADMPQGVSTMVSLVRNAFDDDPVLRATAGERLRAITATMGQVIKTGALEGGKVAAAAFVQSFIVVMERIGPSIGDVLADALSGAFSKALEGYENPLTGQPFKFAKSITGQLADARRQLEELQSPQHLAGGAVVRDVDTPQIREAQQRILQLQAMRRAEEAERSARVTHAVRSWRTEVGAAMGEFDASLSPLTERLGSLLGGSAFVGPPLILDVVKDMTQGFAFAGDEAQKAAPKVKTLLELLSGRAAAFRSANDLRARELTATGRGDDAARLSMLSRFSSEMQQAIGESSDLAAALARVQSIELRRFDLDRSAAAAVRQLTEADAEYRAGLERRSQLVQAGTIDEFQATRQNQQAAQSLRGIAAAAKEMIADLQASNPEFAAVLATYQQTIKQTLDTIGQDARATGSTIGDGLSEGWREFIREAEDHRKQGREIFDSMADSVTGRLASALVDGASNFDTFGQVIRDWASNALRDIATVITRILLLRAIAGIGGGIAGAYANSVSVGIANSGALAVARTGGLVGRDGRISLRGYARGGEIAGPRHHWRDSQIIAAMPGEFMLNRRTVDRIGTARLNHANQGGDLGGSGGGGVSINFAPTISIQGGGGSRPEEMRQQGKVIVDAMFEHLSRSAAGRAALREMLR